MAFCNRFGGLMRQTINQNSAVNRLVPMASMINSIRCMSSSMPFIGGSSEKKKLHIKGLAHQTDDETLGLAFSGFGDVVDARVINVGKENGISGFVTFTSGESARSAILAMDGQQLHGQRIGVEYAKNQLTASRGGGGSGAAGYHGDCGFGGGGSGADDCCHGDGGFGGGAGGSDGF